MAKSWLVGRAACISGAFGLTDRHDTMTYKGYAARIEYDCDDGICTGQTSGIRDRIGFHYDTAQGLREAFHEAFEDWHRQRPELFNKERMAA